MRNQSVVCVVLLFLCAGSLWAVGKKIDTLSWSTEVKLPRTVVDQQIAFAQRRDTHAPASLSSDVIRKRSHYVGWNSINIAKIIDLKSSALTNEEFDEELNRWFEDYKRLQKDAVQYKNSLPHIFDIIEANLSVISMITRENIGNLIEEGTNTFSRISFSS